METSESKRQKRYNPKILVKRIRKKIYGKKKQQNFSFSKEKTTTEGASLIYIFNHTNTFKAQISRKDMLECHIAERIKTGLESGSIIGVMNAADALLDSVPPVSSSPLNERVDYLVEHYEKSRKIIDELASQLEEKEQELGKLKDKYAEKEKALKIREEQLEDKEAELATKDKTYLRCKEILSKI